MKAEVISVGTEILLGEITDTNAPWLAAELPLLGVDLYWVTQVGDNRARLLDALRRAWERSDLILLTGGLGPTEDDLTREGIAELFGEEPYVDEALERWLRDLMERGGRRMPQRNIRQAMLIPSARALPNPRGTAPGWWAERDGRVVVAMPGPPAEMQYMWRHQVVPELQRRLGTGVILTRTLKTTGIGEAMVDEMVSPLLASSNPTAAVYARDDGIHVRLAAKAPDEAGARSLLDGAERQARSILGEAIWGADDDTLASAVGELLAERGLHLGLAEVLTGGFVASLLAEVPESVRFFRGALVAPSPEILAGEGSGRAALAEHGAASPQLALALAETTMVRLGAEVALGIAGEVGGPDASGRTVVSFHLALAGELGSTVNSGSVRPGRLGFKQMVANSALQLLRRAALGRL